MSNPDFTSRKTLLEEAEEYSVALSSCIRRVVQIEKDMRDVHPQSLSKMALENSQIVSQAHLRLCTERYLQWQIDILASLVKHKLIPESHIDRFKANLTFMETVMSTENLEVLCNLVISQGDRWDENP